MNCNTYFDGWDWSELANAWGIYLPYSYAGKDMYAYAEKMRLRTDEEKAEDAKKTYGVIEDDGTVTEHLWDDMFGDTLRWDTNDYEDFNEFDPIIWFIDAAMRGNDGDGSRVTRKMANDVRCFAKKLSESEISYLTPFWKGLSEIESDWTILNIISGNGPLLAYMWD